MEAKKTELGGIDYSSDMAISSRKDLVKLFNEIQLPDDEFLSQLGLFLTSKNLARIMIMAHLYEQIVDTMGVVMEFGCRWGQNLAIWTALRGIYEPFNWHRKIIGFDTFEGFPSLDAKDGNSKLMKKGNLTLPPNHDILLDKLLTVHEQDNPLPHIKKFEIVKGDATETLPEYLEQNKHTIISLAFFDFDIYRPTKICLNLIKPRLVKGSIVAFDELNDADCPGETLAIMETFGLNNIRLKKYKYASRISYFVVE